MTWNSTEATSVGSGKYPSLVLVRLVHMGTSTTDTGMTYTRYRVTSVNNN